MRMPQTHNWLFWLRLEFKHPGGRVGLSDNRWSSEPLHGLVLRGAPHDQVGEGSGRKAGPDRLRELLRRPDLLVSMATRTA